MESAKAYGGEPIPVHFLHVAILGASGTGKTSLLKSLLDELNKEGERSTPGAQLSLYQAWITDAGGWNVIRDNPVACVKRVMDASIAVAPSPVPLPQQSQHTSSQLSLPELVAADASVTPPVLGNGSPKIGRASHQTPLSTPERSWHYSFENIITMVNNLDAKTLKSEAIALISVCDLAGQQLCQCIQPLLMTPHTAFVLTFDSSKRLEDLVRDEVRHDSGSVSLTSVHHDTHLSAMTAWLDMLVLEVGKENMSRSRALLAGCKEDIRLEKGSAPWPDKAIPEKLDGTKYDDVYEHKVFLINNMKSGPDCPEKDPGVVDLRKVLNEKCKCQVDIPAKWLRFTMAILQLKQDTGSPPWISRADAEHLALKVDAIPSSSNLDRLLQYQHKMGQLAYFDSENLREWVIIDLQYVLDTVYAFLQPTLAGKYGNSFPSGVERRSYKRGLLTLGVAVHLLKQRFREDPKKRYFNDSSHVDYLLSLQEELMVLVEVPSDGVDAELKSKSERFFLLPSIAQECEIPAPDLLSPPICLQLSELGHFPVYLYWQFIVELLKECKEKRQPARSRFSVREALIPWNVRLLQWLRIRYSWQGVLLHMEQRKGLSGDSKWPQVSRMGSEALISVIKCLESVRPKSGSAGDVNISLFCLCEEHGACFQHGYHHVEDGIRCPHVAVLPTSSLSLQRQDNNPTSSEQPICVSSKQPVAVSSEALQFWLELSQVGAMVYKLICDFDT